ncbi:MAG: cytochrome c biogenesis protein CcsA [Epsilonproteobacteria bacterium]|nr:cytochrome c biogenesis protein CcsA [Campylobacterota bacterium]
MKNIKKFLFSMELMITLTILFGVASAMGTFIENDHGTETAWAVIYTAKWFELIQILLAINLIGNLFKYNLFRREKLPLLLFHGGFIVVLIGAAITRYIGYEGIMHIREGDTSNLIRSSDSYIQIKAHDGDKQYNNELKILMSKISSNNFELALDIDGKTALLTYKDYIPNAQRAIKEDPNGIAMIDLTILENETKPSQFLLQNGKEFEGKNTIITLNKNVEQSDKPIINIYTKDDQFYLRSDLNTSWFRMSDSTKGILEAGVEHVFEKGKLYDVGIAKFVPKEIFSKAVSYLSSAKLEGGRTMQGTIPSALVANLNYNNQDEEVIMYGFGKGTQGRKASTTIENIEFNFEWGAKLIELPFGIKLNDFQLERYPGSASPSSYASEVTLIDKADGVTMPFRIFMNHVLDYKSHRFFQSSYDMDEGGTILSVNNDPGKIPTYIGYFLLTLGFIFNILNPKSRFRKLAASIQKETLQKTLPLILIALSFTTHSSLQASDTPTNDPLQIAQSYDKVHAAKFGDLLVQTVDGRIKPLDTFSNEVLLKLAKKSKLYDLDSNQILLGMITSPRAWQEIKFISVKHSKVKKILGLQNTEQLASFSDFFDYSKQPAYKLAEDIQESSVKRPIQRNQFDREVIKTDERLNIAYMVFTGDLMKLVPKPKDINHKWYSVKDAISTFESEDSEMIRTMFVNYFDEVAAAQTSKDWTHADQALNYIKTYQHSVASEIIPSQSKLDAEKFFKRISLFNKLILVYLFAGLILLLLIMTKMLKPTINIKLASKIVLAIITLAFLLHTLGLAARWYIGGHAPWSNAYEAMLYVAWSMGLAGLVFARYSLIAPALTGIITGITLGATFINEMDPQITNLVPVLKSYWLNIHVSVITASYGFLGLSMILGFFTMILFIFKTDQRTDLSRSIIEASRINEMTAILGISMLTVGNFLGGIWANESWGRYWGWDPKETWAWISILAYVVVLHIRFIPAIKKNYYYWYAVASTLAYAVIIMTFVGVNYYLSGMHSYAAGDPVPIPNYLYYIIALVVAVIALSYPKRVLKV